MTTVRTCTNAVRAAALALVLGVAAPTLAAAQASVGGSVYDSLGGRPFEGARVQLVPAATLGAPPRQVDADSLGRYRIPDLGAGRYLLSFEHPRLDSLGMEAALVTVDVGATDVRADLGVPSARTIVEAICGARVDSTGLLLGRVLDAGSSAPAPDTVFVSWSEIRVDASGVHRATPTVRAPVDPDGRYAACGIPTDAPVEVLAVGVGATGLTTSSGAVELQFPPSTLMVHRDLLVDVAGAGATGGRSTAAAPTARLLGHVRRPDGRPVPGALVLVGDAGAAGRSVTTDADGAFALDALPGGSRAVEARAIGFMPSRGIADLRPGRTARLDLSLGAPVQMLDRVSVYASRIRPTSEYAHRMRLGFGRYITPEQIAARGTVTSVAEVLAMLPGLRVTGVAADGRPVVGGRLGCTPRFYLDGMSVDDASEIDRFAKSQSIGGVEYYDDPDQAPAQYVPPRSSGGTCAVVLVWTRAALY